MYKTHVAFEFSMLGGALFVFISAVREFHENGVFWGLSVVFLFLLRSFIGKLFKNVIKKGMVDISPTELTYSRWKEQTVRIEEIEKIELFHIGEIHSKDKIDELNMTVNDDDYIIAFTSSTQPTLYLTGILFRRNTLIDIIEEVTKRNSKIVKDTKVYYYLQNVKNDNLMLGGWIVGVVLIVATVGTLLANHSLIGLLF